MPERSFSVTAQRISLLITAVFLVPLFSWSQTVDSIIEGNFSIRLGGHRSGRLEWPENTVTAIRAFSGRWKQALIEVDVQTTADGKLILLHDLDVDSVTNGSGVAMLMQFEALRALDAGWQFTRDRKEYPYRGQGVVIPTLQEALAAAPDHPFLIEMKDGAEVAKATAAAIREACAEQRCFVATVNPVTLAEFKSEAPEIATCYDVLDAAEAIAALRNGAWDSYTPPHRMFVLSLELQKQFDLSWEELRRFQERGILLCFFTVNREDEMKHLESHGVDCILTDYPARLAAVLGYE